jgi:hypothetical protein
MLWRLAGETEVTVLLTWSLEGDELVTQRGEDGPQRAIIQLHADVFELIRDDATYRYQRVFPFVALP